MFFKELNFEPDPREIGFAFHRAGTDIEQISVDFEMDVLKLAQLS